MFSAPPTLWDIDFVQELATCVDHMPRNGLQEMIDWTKDGRMWRYPIDNEAGNSPSGAALMFSTQ